MDIFAGGRSRRRFFRLAGGMLLAPGMAVALPAAAGEVDVVVSNNGSLVTITAGFSVPVGAPLAWEVMTDYDHMTQFLPHLESSKVIERRRDNRLLVEQSGAVPVGPLSLPFIYVREVALYPYTEFRSHVVSGTVERADVTTQLSPIAGGTHVAYRSEVVSGAWLPFGIGNAFIADNLRQQLTSMRAEMLRRNGGADGGAQSRRAATDGSSKWWRIA